MDLVPISFYYPLYKITNLLFSVLIAICHQEDSLRVFRIVTVVVFSEEMSEVILEMVPGNHMIIW